VIEAKAKGKGNPLYEKDRAQLLEAEHWFKEACFGRALLRNVIPSCPGGCVGAVGKSPAEAIAKSLA
jgi:hypothetical protein